MSETKPSALPGRSDVEVTRAFVRALDAYAKNLAAHRQFTERYCPHPPGMAGVLRDIEPATFFAQNKLFHQQGDALWNAVAERLPEMTRLAVRYGIGSGVFCVFDRYSAEDVAAARAAASAVAGETTKALAEGAPVTMPAAPAVKPAPVVPAATVYQQIKAGPDRRVSLRELAKAVGKSERVIQGWRKNSRVLKACPELKRVSAQVACRGAGVPLHKAADAFHAANYLK